MFGETLLAAHRARRALALSEIIECRVPFFRRVIGHVPLLLHRRPTKVSRHFRYDPFAHIPKEQCTVGALRAQAKDVDLSPRVGGGGKKPSDDEAGYCTIGDIIKQMAHALSTLFDSSTGGK
jgi:hypothetical protein